MPENNLPIEGEDMPTPQEMGSTLINKFLFVYGPYGFSLASLLLLWLTIVDPVLDRAAIDFEKSQRLVDALQTISTTQAENARTLERATLVLDAMLKRIETHGAK